VKNITITTSQHVKIEYALATWAERLIAFVLDTVLTLIGAVVLYLILIDHPFLFKISMLFYFMFFNLTIELLNDGQSLGKRIFKLKVVKLNAKQMHVSDYLLRACFSLFDIVGSVGLLATFLIATTRFNQRLGDLLANTCVIQLNPRNPIKLNSILSIKTTASYTPVYTAITKLREEDIVLAKIALEEFKKYNNVAYAACIDACAEKFMEVMGLSDHAEVSHVDFLKICIKDYIVLTR
jgi:uncharacterized RDD family membrane protein YckC